MVVEYRYIDIIWIDNIIMNFILLYTTAGVTKDKSPRWRFWLASALGAFYALGYIILGAPIFNHLVFKFLLSLAMVIIGFGYRTMGRFLRLLGVFYGTTFLFGGGALGLYYFTEGILSLRNGRFYIENFPLKILFISVTLTGTLVHTLWPRLKGRWVKDSLIYSVDIRYKDSKVVLKGLLDTGNSLRDPLTQKPVIVVEYDAVRDILPKSIGDIFTENGGMDTDPLMNTTNDKDIMNRFRLIPYYALGKAQGMLPGFRVNGVYIRLGDRVIDGGEAYIGIYNRNLSEEGDYRALIHPELLWE